MPERIVAMWSGPRSISTAMMRAWANRADTRVVDEPFYAHYLQQTSFPHPGADEIMDKHECDWRKVLQSLQARQDRSGIFYQKHMAQHMLEHIDRDWLLQVSNCFLLREPRRVLLSFVKLIPQPTLAQTGYLQQLELFQFLKAATGVAPPVLHAGDVLRDPEGSLRLLCLRLRLPFDAAMLSWKPGIHNSDGVWAKHWYGNVARSSGFLAYREDTRPPPPHLTALWRQCQALYEQMAGYSLREYLP